MTAQGQAPTLAKVWVVLILGVVAVSTSSIFIRLAMATAGEQGIGFSLFIAATRLVFASVILAPTWRTVANSRPTKAALGYAIAAGVALALHFSLWISSLSFISVAASTSLVTTNPIWVALISWLWLGEKLSRQKTFGIGLGILGSVIVASGAGEMGGFGSPVLGAFLALAGSWAVSFYVLWGREAQAQGLTIRNYAAIAYTTAAVLLLPMPWLFGVGYAGYPLAVYGYILLMAAIAQLFGHTSLNWSLRWLSPVTVTLLVLCEPVIASILGFFVLKEIPSLSVIMGGCIIFLGVAIAIFQRPIKSKAA